MDKETFDKWIDVLTRAENKNKALLKSGEISQNYYILLNKINSDKYEQIVKEYNQ